MVYVIVHMIICFRHNIVIPFLHYQIIIICIIYYLNIIISCYEINLICDAVKLSGPNDRENTINDNDT